LYEGGVGLQKVLHTLLKFTESSFGELVLKRGGGMLEHEGSALDGAVDDHYWKS